MKVSDWPDTRRGSHIAFGFLEIAYGIGEYRPMSLQALSSLLQSLPQYQRLRDAAAKPMFNGRVQVLPNASPFTLATLWRDLNIPVLVIAPRPEDARRLHEQLLVWNSDEESLLHFPEAETLPFERLASDIGTTHQRLTAWPAFSQTPARSCRQRRSMSPEASGRRRQGRPV